MAQFVRRSAREEKLPVGTIHGAFGSVQGYPQARHADMATSPMELLSDSSGLKLEIEGMLLQHDRVKEAQRCTSTPLYVVYAQQANTGLCWSSTLLGRAPHGLCAVSIPNNVRELCDRCFHGCRCLRLVTFGSSSSLERIGAACFEGSRVEEVSIPNSVRELCDGCFQGCESLHRVTFGSSSSLERIGAYCFVRTKLEEVRIPDSVRELCDGCFQRCTSLCRVTFGSSSSLERIGVSCCEGAGVEEISIPDSVRELCNGCFQRCRSLRRLTFGSLSSLNCGGAHP